MVSILIPAYNCEAYIETCMDGILSQTYADIEILIADDGSTDATRNLIDRYTDPRIKRFHQNKNAGNLKTINKLLSKAGGQFIAFQDADDWCDKERIQKQVDFLFANPGISFCGTEYRYVNPDQSFEILKELPLSPEAIMEFVRKFHVPPFCAASCMFKKEVYDSIGGFRPYFDGIGAADFDWHFRILEKYKAANLPEILYFYRKNPSSITFTMSTDLRKLIGDKIAYFLYEQRLNTKTDALISNNHRELDLFMKSQLQPYYKEPSLICNKMTMSLIHQGRKGLALKYALLGIVKAPFKRKNYSMLKYWFWKQFVNKELNQELIRQF